jgi:hypothetical protein
VELVQLDTLPIGSPHHRECGSNVFESDQASNQRAFNRRLALELEPQFGKERFHCFEIVDNDEDVVHSFNCHVFQSVPR